MARKKICETSYLPIIKSTIHQLYSKYTIPFLLIINSHILSMFCPIAGPFLYLWLTMNHFPCRHRNLELRTGLRAGVWDVDGCWVWMRASCLFGHVSKPKKTRWCPHSDSPTWFTCNHVWVYARYISRVAMVYTPTKNWGSHQLRWKSIFFRCSPGAEGFIPILDWIMMGFP